MVALPQRHRGLLLATLGGVAFALTSPPTDIFPAVIVGLAFLAAVADEASSARRAFGRGIVWGTAAGVVGLRFVPDVVVRYTPLGSAGGYLALVLLALGQAVPWGMGALATHLARHRAKAPLELSFALGVMVTVLVPTIFAWTPAGLVSPWPSFVQLADFIGERGVSVIFAALAALLVRAVRLLMIGPSERRKGLRTFAIFVGGFAALAAFGRLRMASIEASSEALPRLRVALVDQAVQPLERWDPKNNGWILQRLRDLTLSAEEEGAELTVWPEAAYPHALNHEERKAPKGSRAIIGQGVRGPVLFGLITHARPVRLPDGTIEINSYNSATLLTPDGAMQAPYDKLQLLWFGEMVPGGQYFPWLRRIFQKSGGLIPGEEPRALTLDRTGSPTVRMAILNCYEDTLPSVGRLVTRTLSPNLLVNVTNDAWFVGSAEPELHARLGAMRAIEMRRDLVRSVNLGVASWVDASGQVRANRPSADPGVLIATPALREDSLTLYAMLGDGPLVAVLIAAIGFRYWRARKSPESAPTEATRSPRPSTP